MESDSNAQLGFSTDSVSLRLPLLVITSLSIYRRLKNAPLNSLRHMTLDALQSIVFSICTFTIYLLVMLIDVHVHIILQSTSFYWRDVVRQNGALKATLSKYLVVFDIFFQRRNDKETN